MTFDVKANLRVFGARKLWFVSKFSPMLTIMLFVLSAAFERIFGAHLKLIDYCFYKE